MGIGPFRVVVREALPTRPEVRHYGKQSATSSWLRTRLCPGPASGHPLPHPAGLLREGPRRRSKAPSLCLPAGAASRGGPSTARPPGTFDDALGGGEVDVPPGHGPLGLLLAPGHRRTCASAFVSSGLRSPVQSAHRARPRLLRAAQAAEGGGRGGPASHPTDRMGPARRSSRGAESGAPATPAEGRNSGGRGGSGPGSRARARAPARRSPDFPAARAAPRQVLRGPLTPRPRAAGSAA